MKVLMVGVDEKTKGGMWSVARGYLQSQTYREATNVKYVATATVGSSLKKLLFFGFGFLKIAVLLISKKWDIVHVHMSERGSVYRKLAVAMLAKLFRCKVAVHMHGAEFETWYNSLPEKKKRNVRRGLNGLDSVLILGEYWRPFISSLMEEKQKVKVLYNAVSVPQENRYQIEAKNMLFLGEVGRRKGVYDLLTAMKTIDGQLDDSYQLQIYGPNPDGDIEKRIQEHNLQHRVRYNGWADPSQFEQLFAGVAVNILPSYHEGLPMTILETMAYGIPNITTSVAAIPEAVNQENGALLQPGDTQTLAAAILILLQNPQLRKEKSENAYQTMKNTFSTEQHIGEVLKLYEEMIKLEK